MVFKREGTSALLEVLKHIAGPFPTVPFSEGLGWGLSISVSNKTQEEHPPLSMGTHTLRTTELKRHRTTALAHA